MRSRCRGARGGFHRELIALVVGLLAGTGPAWADDVDDGIVQLTKPPSLLIPVAPEYPVEARKAGREGVVRLEVTIDATGAVERVEVIGSAGKDLDFAALGAASQFKFSPAEWNGVPGRSVVEYRVNFRIADVEPVRAKTPKTGAAVTTGAPARLTGRVRRAGTMAPVQGAEISLLHQGGFARTRYSDEDGRFSAGDLEPGRWRIEVAASGYELLTVDEELAPGADEDVVLHLGTDVADPFQTIIRARRNRASVSRVTLSRDEVKGIPGTFGDALRVIESLPGVARAPLLGGALIVRGGMPGDSRIFMDGVEVPVLYHWGGFSSVINSELLEEIRFFPGGFGVEYGRATAGVVDVKSHALRFDAPTGTVDIDVLDTGFFFGTGIQVGELPEVSLAFAARRSYLEGLAAAGLSAASLVGFTLPFVPVPNYFDFQLKMQTRPLPGNRVSLFVFGADDRFSVLGDSPPILDEGGQTLDFNTLVNNLVANSFYRAVLEWELRPARGVRHTFRPFVGVTQKGLLSDNVVVEAFTGNPFTPPQTQQNWGARDELRIDAAPWLAFVAGVEHTGTRLGFSLGEPLAQPVDECPETGTLEDLLCIRPFDVEGTMLTTAGYARLEVGPIGGLVVNPGLRIEHIALDYEDKLGTVRDVTGASKQLKQVTSVDPRMSLRWQLGERYALKGVFGLYRGQPRLEPFVLDNDGIPLDAPRALHLIAGFEYSFTDALSIDAQLYGVRRDQLIRDSARRFSPESGGVNPFATLVSQPSSFDNDGDGETWGFEVMLRHRPTRYFFGWVAYTFSRTIRDVGEERDPFSPAPFDQNHNLVLVGKVNLPWEFTLGTRFQLVTGNPSPVPASMATIHYLLFSGPGSYQALPSTLRRPRVPTYHRLDVRLDKKVTFDAFSVTGYLEVINVYNQFNAEIVIPGQDFRQRGTMVLLPSVPFMPTLGLAGEF